MPVNGNSTQARYHRCTGKLTAVTLRSKAPHCGWLL